MDDDLLGIPVVVVKVNYDSTTVLYKNESYYKRMIDLYVKNEIVTLQI